MGRPLAPRVSRPDQPMEPRTALVTGSARGIGQAIAERLAALGYSVIGVDVASDAPSGTLRYDLSSWDACQELVASTPDIDVLVNNAAILIEKTPDEITENDFQTMLSVNLRAPFLLTREYIRTMQQNGHGRVINVSSVSARTGGFAATGVYAASKAGLIALTKYFARLYAPDGITVNAVAPERSTPRWHRRNSNANPASSTKSPNSSPPADGDVRTKSRTS